MPEIEIFSFIRWVGLYHPAYRIASTVKEAMDSENKVTVNVLYFDVGKDTLKSKLKQLNCDIVTGYSDIIRVSVEPNKICDIAKLDGVMWIEMNPAYVLF